MNQDKKLRRKYFIRGGIQSRFISLNIMLAILVSLFIATSIYQISKEMLGGKLEEVYPAGLLKNIYGAVDRALGLRLLVIIPLVIVATIFVSHQLAGPIYHIEQALLAMSEGDLSSRIYLRAHDELKPIAARINKMLDLVSQNLNSVERDLGAIEKLSGDLRQPEFDLSRRQDISEKLAASLKSIRETLSQLKTKC